MSITHSISHRPGNNRAQRKEHRVGSQVDQGLKTLGPPLWFVQSSHRNMTSDTYHVGFVRNRDAVYKMLTRILEQTKLFISYCCF